MFSWLCVLGVSLLWILQGSDAASLQTSSRAPHNPTVSTKQFKLLPRPRDFALQFVSSGKTKQVAIPRDWLIPPAEEKDEEFDYVSSFHYDKEVASFPIGNGRTGLHISSYAIDEEGSAHAAAGRDVFLIFDPASSAVSRGGIARGITKQRVRSQGCRAASAEKYLLADVDGDGLTDIGVVKEELQCVEKEERDVDITVGPFYKKHPVVWYVFKENAWKLNQSFSGKFPEDYQELPLIGIDRDPVDYVGCSLWKTCDRTKWATGENDQQRKEQAPERTAGTAAANSPLGEIHAVTIHGLTAHFGGRKSPVEVDAPLEYNVEALWFTFEGDWRSYVFKPTGELFFTDWSFDLFSPDGAHVLLPQSHYGPYHVVATDRLKNYLIGCVKPNYVVTKRGRRIDPATVHSDGHWISAREIQFTVACCESSETLTYRLGQKAALKASNADRTGGYRLLVDGSIHPERDAAPRGLYVRGTIRSANNESVYRFEPVGDIQGIGEFGKSGHPGWMELHDGSFHGDEQARAPARPYIRGFRASDGRFRPRSRKISY
jgi:hypothetical protein